MTPWGFYPILLFVCCFVSVYLSLSISLHSSYFTSNPFLRLCTPTRHIWGLYATTSKCSCRWAFFTLHLSLFLVPLSITCHSCRLLICKCFMCWGSANPHIFLSNIYHIGRRKKEGQNLSNNLRAAYNIRVIVVVVVYYPRQSFIDRSKYNLLSAKSPSSVHIIINPFQFSLCVINSYSRRIHIQFTPIGRMLERQQQISKKK